MLFKKLGEGFSLEYLFSKALVGIRYTILLTSLLLFSYSYEILSKILYPPWIIQTSRIFFFNLTNAFYWIGPCYATGCYWYSLSTHQWKAIHPPNTWYPFTSGDSVINFKMKHERHFSNLALESENSSRENRMESWRNEFESTKLEKYGADLKVGEVSPGWVRPNAFPRPHTVTAFFFCVEKGWQDVSDWDSPE